MIAMGKKACLQELMHDAGIAPIPAREPCLPPPEASAVTATEEDDVQVTDILERRRKKNPAQKPVLRRIFTSSKEKEKLLDTTQWEFSSEELEQALSAVLRLPTSSPGLVKAFVNRGLNVNFVSAPSDDAGKKTRKSSSTSSTPPPLRSTVLQQAAALRRPHCVSILASAGADQVTLDLALKSALANKDLSCVEILLRHGADVNKSPGALATLVAAKDVDFTRLILRAPTPLRPAIISAALLDAVKTSSTQLVFLLLSYGANPNYSSACALNLAIGSQNYPLTLTLVSSPIPLLPSTLQYLLDTTMRLPTPAAQLKYLQVLFCCGLPAKSIGLAELLGCTVRRGDVWGTRMMVGWGVWPREVEREMEREKEREKEIEGKGTTMHIERVDVDQGNGQRGVV